MHPDTNPILIPGEDGVYVALAFLGVVLCTFTRSFFLSFSYSWKPVFHLGGGAAAVALQTSSKFLNKSLSVATHGNLEHLFVAAKSNLHAHNAGLMAYFCCMMFL